MQTSQSTIYDVIIIGAGITGIGTAYWLQKKCPDKSFLILEARHTLGGTWSLFQYPGIRSDSDMFTFGYRFKPWKNPQPISAGGDILQYLQETVSENHLAQKIRFHHKMVEAHWSDVTNTWTLHIQTLQGIEIFVCRFLSICTRYYSYDEAQRP
ncbi:MAG TPA: FAD-containing monooxygenase EthA, partial [Microscillaceae bacterium]|nr:FAD-containing monooxygenase EthA [Microscillaceae bacterium]